MRKVRIYLGGSRGNWREIFQRLNPDVECYDPFKHSRQRALIDFGSDDFWAIRDSDIVFLLINYPVFTGACIEAGYAYALGKPIILVFELKGYIEPLLLGVSRKIFTDFNSALEWFKKSEHIKKVRS